MKTKLLARPLVSAVLETLHDKLTGYMQRAGLMSFAAHTAVESITDTTFAISATLPATYDAAGYGATSITYTAIGKVRVFPAFGSERDIKKWQPIAGAVEKSKGAPDYGEGDMILGDLPADAGQVILKAAEASANRYSMKVTFPDGEIYYLDVLVASWRLTMGGEGDFNERTAKLALCRAPVVVAAA